MADNNFNNINDELLDWDDEITSDGFPLLPDGDYDFTIVNFERDRFSGSEKMPACPKANVTICIESAHGTTNIIHSFFMVRRNEWQLGEFFLCIGLKKPGETLKPNWSAVVGTKGRCKVGKRTYNDKDYNEVKKFYAPSTGNNSNAGFDGGF